MKARLATTLLLAATAPAAAFDFNGLELGAPESAVQKSVPRAHCQPLQWPSRAADRRCDSAHATFAGVPARVTFYLNEGRVAAFDVGLGRQDADRIAALFTQRYGAPVAETGPSKTGGVERRRWEDGREQAVLMTREQRRRASLFVSRPGFEEELYRVR